MNDLAPPTNLPARKPTSPELSPGLSALLDRDGPPDEAAREIASYLALREEARAALPALQAVAQHKAGEDGVRAVIGRRFALYPQPERNDGEWDAWWADYYDCLSDVPLACLEAAMRAWVARPDSLFMPKPGELRDLAFRTPSRSLQRYQRARRAVQLFDNPDPPPISPEASGVAVDHVSAVKSMLADYQQKFASRPAAAKPVLPSIAGKPDEGGLTPEMRALMERNER